MWTQICAVSNVARTRPPRPSPGVSGIPYVHIADFHIGPIPLHPFGLLVALGVLIGIRLAARRARQLGVDGAELSSFITWMLAGGFIGGHVLDTVFYHPGELIARPWSLLFLWEGLSSFGGFVGAFIGIALWRSFEHNCDLVALGPIALPRFRRRAKTRPILPLADLILSVFPVAWIFGRAGCSVVHDHPGARTTAESWFAVAYPNAAPTGPVPADVPRDVFGPLELVHGSFPRFDLGLLELMFTVVLAALLAVAWRKKLPTGAYIAATSLAYAPVRFAMDGLRIHDGAIADPRYGGLTPAQWTCIALFLFGLFMIRHMKRGRSCLRCTYPA
jgi:phosphatidylglycerol---prolipoprotein diacylglyceryl transferase